ncbi:MAG: transporter [Hyphomicrobiales bacterium]|nr:transporter [Hyphomicrobiales bacterium]
MISLALMLFLAGLWAGAQNALAGGGSFVTLPALILSGMDPRAANVTSTLALFPGQIATGWAGRSMVTGTETVSARGLVIVSLIGGVFGAILLLETPVSVFARLVPWLVLFATAVYAWGSFRGAPKSDVRPKPRWLVIVSQILIAIYGGYFGGGIGFLMLAALTIAGLPVRSAGATKNVLAGVMNASAVLIFAFSSDAHWWQALVVGTGAMAGGLAGAWLLRRVNERILRALVVVIGICLTLGLFLRPI